MSPPVMEKLLVLQDRDAKRLSLEHQLAAIPREIEAVNHKIADEKAAIEAARLGMRELESKKKLLETDLAATEETIVKYKNQQMQVRKNDEYQALTHQITTAQAAIAAT
jgi:predicted  nucleic acid-binding Zn-ribbon protein